MLCRPPVRSPPQDYPLLGVSGTSQGPADLVEEVERAVSEGEEEFVVGLEADEHPSRGPGPPLRLTSVAPAAMRQAPAGTVRRGPAAFLAGGQRSPAKRSFSGTAAPVVSLTRTKVSTPIKAPNLSLPILRKKMFSP